MTRNVLTSAEFESDAHSARTAANNGPVFIIDQGRVLNVLMSFADYKRLAGTELSLLDALAQPDAVDFDFEPLRLTALSRPADLEDY